MDRPRARPFLLFDLGGVLVENAGFERMQALLPQPMAIGALKQRWLSCEHVRAFERGHIGADAFAERLVDGWRLNCSSDSFITEFTTWPRGFYDGALELLAHLRRSYRIGCLTNSNVLHWQRFGGFDGLFDVTLSSHLLGVIKPDAACFERALDACGVERSQVLFFDDSKPNVDAADTSGIRALQVEGFDQLRAALECEGLLA